MESLQKMFANRIERLKENVGCSSGEQRFSFRGIPNFNMESILCPKITRKRPIEKSASTEKENNRRRKVAKYSALSNDRICYSLLNLFTEYVQQEDDDDIDCSESVRQLVKWLTDEKINVNNPDWFSEHRSKIWNYKCRHVLPAKLAYDLRHVLHIIFTCNGDINHTDDDGRTILHVFLANHAKENANLPKVIKQNDCVIIETLLDKGASVDIVDDQENTPVHLAFKSNRRDLLKIMLPHFNNVNATDCYGHTVLHFLVRGRAKKSDWISEIRLFLSTKRPNINKRNVAGLSPLHLAAKSCDIPLMRLLKRNGGDFNFTTGDGETPLLLFCKKCNDETKQMRGMRLLMTGKCDINVRDSNGFTTLHFVARYWRNIEAIERLIDLGADLNLTTHEQKLAPIHWALWYGENSYEKVRALVYNGADVNLVTSDKLSPLLLSMARGSVECMKFLIEHDADITHREQTFALSPLHLMAFRSEEEKMKLLLDNGASHRVTTYNGMTPLHVASMVGNLSLVKLLVERGADIECTSIGAKFMTPLHFASLKSMSARFLNFKNNNGRGLLKVMISNGITSRNEDVIQFLVEKGADINAKDISGKTPLHLAILEKKPDAFEMLLKLGASVDIEDSEKLLPIHYAIDMRKLRLLESLLKYGLENLNDLDVCAGIVMRNDILDVAIEKCIVKLYAAELPFSSRYNQFVNNWIDMNVAEYDRMIEEVRKMKSCFLNNNVSIYNLIHMDVKKLFDHFNCLPDCIDIEFPIYRDIIRATLRDAKEKQPLIKVLMLAWYHITEVYLPDECVEHILCYLSNRNLRNLITSLDI